MSLCGNFARMGRMNSLFNRKKVVVMVAHGGVGEFLFQVDLAMRFKKVGITSIILVKNKYTFFKGIVDEVEDNHICLVNREGWRYYMYMPSVWLLCLMRDVTIINSFNSLYYRLPTKIFYNIAKLFSARIVVSKHKKENVSYEQVPYEKEMVWQRNNRIVEYVTGTHFNEGFPIIKFKSYEHQASSIKHQVGNKYIHIHPVGSILAKSYPVKKLIEVVKKLQEDNKIIITLTPSEERWYVTDELRDFVNSSDNVELIIKYFPIKEIISLIANAQVFCTVNTGLLWLSLMIGQKVVVCDYFTDNEWNPKEYPNVTRLSHDYDENGNGLHHVLKKHEDGTYFESMYLVTPDEFSQAIMHSI